jgi:hypothetical protein
MTANSPEYRRNHRAVRKARGPAHGYGCCRCARQANNWAQVHGTDGTDPQEHYMPMCIWCHAAYDHEPGYRNPHRNWVNA